MPKSLALVVAHVKHRSLRALYRAATPMVARWQRYNDGRSAYPLPPPYAYVQDDLVANLPAYLGVNVTDVRRVVIVGAWHGEELAELLERYRRCEFLLLEPSREAYEALIRRWGAEPRVRCLPVAAAEADGRVTFHEMSVTGNGSLLPLSDAADDVFLAPGITESSAYEVDAVRLDGLAELDDDAAIDCLWVDVQGFELAVLRGAEGLLGRVRSAFLEVATDQRSYEGAASFGDVQEAMADAGFRLASLGTNPATGQGNALWLRARATT
jgi:FkbM family methyltransferase